MKMNVDSDVNGVTSNTLANIDRGFPFLEYAPTLFAKWNRRAVPGTTGWR